jgi:hypothetical protein
MEPGIGAGWYVVSPDGKTRLDGPYEHESDAETAIEEKDFEEGSYVYYVSLGLRYQVKDKVTGEMIADFDSEGNAEAHRMALPNPEDFVVVPNNQTESDIRDRVDQILG